MNIFDSNSRHESPMWIIKQIEFLREEAIYFNSSSKLIYACFETRNLLESIEFIYVFAAVDEAERKKAWETIRKEDGIHKTFRELGNSIHHYQTFLIELCKVVNINVPIYFDFKQSRRFKTQLNEYCHIYGRGDDELKYNSNFIKKGFSIINEVFEYLHKIKFYPSEEGGVNIVGTPISSFDTETKKIYQDWINNKIKSIEELSEKIKELNDSRNTKS